MVRVVPPGGGELIGDAPDRRVELLADGDAVHVTWSRFGPRRPGADLHVHRRHTDLFYVLEGEFVLLLGADGAPVAMPAGTLARVPPLVVHGFRAGEAGARFLNLHAPGVGFADFMRALRDGRAASYDQWDPPADGGRAPGEAAVGEARVLVDRDGLRVTQLADEDAIAIREVRTDGSSAPPRQPVSRQGVRFAYVLEGECTVTSGAHAVRVPAGSWVQAPAGAPLDLAPAAGRPARLLEVRAG